MNSSPSSSSVSRIWQKIGVAIIVGVCLYYGFVGVNTLALANHTAVATVLDKKYYAPGTSYQTMNIGGRNFVRPYQTAETWVFKLRVNGQETAAIVEKSLYDRLNPNDEVRATYQRCRITGALRVVQVAPAAEKGGH